jgi:formate dehydrogenase beta subunit
MCRPTNGSRCHGPRPNWRWPASGSRWSSAFDAATAFKEAGRCLNCDVQTVFNREACIECDACVDICPMDCITFTTNGDESDLRPAQGSGDEPRQDLYVSAELKTGHVMVKDEDVCLHCGLCAERCPTGAWDMQKFC